MPQQPQHPHSRPEGIPPAMSVVAILQQMMASLKGLNSKQDGGDGAIRLHEVEVTNEKGKREKKHKTLAQVWNDLDESIQDLTDSVDELTERLDDTSEKEKKKRKKTRSTKIRASKA